MTIAKIATTLGGALVLAAGYCALAIASGPWNSPYPVSASPSKVFYTVFQERPKHLDPVLSYSENEAQFTAQIYEPPLQYHFLKRPYELTTLTATAVPVPQYYDSDGQLLPSDAPDALISRAVYRITLQPGILYAPHPAFARDANGELLYQGQRGLPRATSLDDFTQTGTRELVADDYVYQIKRFANPHLQSPVAGLLSTYILGLDTLAATLRAEHHGARQYIDLRRYKLLGARSIDQYTFEIALSKKYPQFIYWLAMPFFAPIPWEADAFYSQAGMRERNLTLDWHPIGTGAYMLTENNPNRRMVLRRNPHFRGERYPDEGERSDAANGWLKHAGMPMPFIDEVHFVLEKEDIPEWNKFMQGYYDSSPVAPDGFDQAIRFTPEGTPEVTPLMQGRKVSLEVATQPSISYVGFNMLDLTVGGYSSRARDLRQALSIAVDMEEMISIFNNGRGVPAHGPLPPGIFGYRTGRAGANSISHDWRDGRAQRKPLAEAEQLLRDAGYPDGRDPTTGKALTLYFDAMTTGPDMKSRFDWYRKQFKRIGIDLVIRSTDYNRFQDKIQKGDAQIFSWGWNADYPDPENFLFLLYGPNGKVVNQGENAANYANPQFDKLFERMRTLPNNRERQRVIDEMLAIVRNDAPWLWGFYPQAYTLNHQWVGNAKPNMMARNTLKYRTIDSTLRATRQREWNAPRVYPLVFVAALIAVGFAAAITVQHRRRQATAL
jgi:oligopeptide transport system substrate-binding protein